MSWIAGCVMCGTIARSHGTDESAFSILVEKAKVHKEKNPHHTVWVLMDKPKLKTKAKIKN
jgi:hypothetical protein